MLATVITVVLSTLAAYAFARMRFRGRNVLFYSVLATMAFPAYTTLIPLYRIMSTFGLVNTFTGIVLVYVSGFLPLATWILHSYMSSLPIALEEAGEVDGAGRLQVLWHIVLPLALPGVMSTAIITFLFAWAQFLFPLVLSSDLSTQPLTVVIAALQGRHLVPFSLLSAAGVFALAVPAFVTDDPQPLHRVRPALGQRQVNPPEKAAHMSESLGRITTAEIDSQPDCWLRAAAMALAGVPGLPEPGERVLVLGCGTSFFVAQAYASLREGSGQGLTDAVIASELIASSRSYDRVLALSRSGTTTEVVQALGLLPAGTPVTAVLGELGTPVADQAADIVDLSFADEHSVVQTRFPTSLLTLLRTHLGLGSGELALLVEAARTVLSDAVTEPMPRQLVVLGRGWAAPLAQEAALKCRESAGMWAEAYATGEYRHGPISVAGPGTLVWAFTPMAEVEAEAVRATGATLRQATGDALVELVAAQRHAVAWAAAAGRDADLPRHLTRSVTAV